MRIGQKSRRRCRRTAMMASLQSAGGHPFTRSFPVSREGISGRIMGRRRHMAIILLGYSATYGQAFLCRPFVGVVAQQQLWHPGKGHVTTESSFRPSKRAATGCLTKHIVSMVSSVPGSTHISKSFPTERGERGATGLGQLLKLTAPILAVCALAASVLLFPCDATAADTLAVVADPEWTRYAFMFPVGILVATCAQTAGIGGAAIMGPFFLLGLPLIGPSYPLHSVAASIATAILCEAFGFSSGLFGYFRRGLIDTGSAVPFILASLPACLLGAIVVPYADERVLKALYAIFMLGLSAYLLFDEGGSESLIPEECSVEELESGEIRAVCSTDGQEYIYKRPDFGAGSGFSTAFGGLMTGMLGVGIGEVVIPQLVKKNGVPLPVAAGTSVLVVFLNAVVAAGTQIGGIISRGPEEIPWSLIVFIVPGVIIGGQLGPSLQGKLSQRTMEKLLAVVFGCVGATFATLSLESLLAMSSASASLP